MSKHSAPELVPSESEKPPRTRKTLKERIAKEKASIAAHESRREAAEARLRALLAEQKEKAETALREIEAASEAE